MRLVKSIKPVFIVIAIVFTIIMLFGALTLNRMSNVFTSHDDLAKVTLRNFTPGARVDYRILSSAGIIAEDQTQVDTQGALSLPINKSVLVSVPKESTIKYELKVAEPKIQQKGKQEAEELGNYSEPDSAELLNLMLSLNPSDGKIDLSVKGLEEFSDVVLKENGQAGQKLKADWAGIFATTQGNTGDQAENGINDYNQLQLVFQNAGIQSDLLKNQAGMPLVEVQAITGALLGTSDRDKETAHWSGPIAMLTEQLSAVMVQQTEIIGMFFDASIQMETQRKLQELQARAHKDYHPSEQMCRIGSYVRSIAHSESKAELEKEVLNKYLINQYTGVINTSAAGGPDVYEGVRIKNYTDDYCHSVDNGSAVDAICDAVTGATSAIELDRINKDIDYTRAIETKLTLDINFLDGVSDPDEEDIFALARYLYFPSAFNTPKKGALAEDVRPHYESRSYAAKMGVAHNSFINIIGMKASAPHGRPTTATAVWPTVAPFGTGVPVEDRQPPPPAGPDDDVRSKTAGVGIGQNGECRFIPGGAGGGEGVCLRTERLTTRPAPMLYTEDSGWAYMKSMLQKDFGLAVVDIDEILGVRPSYYAQMEVLTKKIYQNPDFYTNLYDKPANVKRIGASLDAILLMNQRDRFESLLRREMLAATMIENTLYDKVSEINSGMYEEMQRSQFE